MDPKQGASNTAEQPIDCRAAVALEVGEPLVIMNVVVAPPKAYEVRIRILYTSLCHSDVSAWKQIDFGYYPRIFGHEAIGVVESIGENVNEFTEGDLVIPQYLAYCGECVDCLSERSNQCSKFPFEIIPWMPRDKTSRFTDVDGNTLYHFHYVSSFSEYTVVDVTHLTKIDPAFPHRLGSLLSCGVPTGVGAAWKEADVKEGSTVVIYGLGTIGLAVAEGARLRGAKKIIGIDKNTDKFIIGGNFGVTDFINNGPNGDIDVSQEVIGMTDGGIGADYCFECVGLSRLMNETLLCCRKGWGKTVVLGVDTPDTNLSINQIVVLHTQKTLLGSLYGGCKPKIDIPMFAQLYMNQELQLDGFVTHERNFEQINEAFDLLAEGKSLRCVIKMGN